MNLTTDPIRDAAWRLRESVADLVTNPERGLWMSPTVALALASLLDGIGGLDTVAEAILADAAYRPTVDVTAGPATYGNLPDGAGATKTTPDTVLPPLTAEHFAVFSKDVPDLPCPVDSIGEEGEYWVAYGHRDLHDFMPSVKLAATHLGMSDDDPDDWDWTASRRFEHCYAVTETWTDPGGEWHIRWEVDGRAVTRSTPGAFPITLLSLVV